MEIKVLPLGYIQANCYMLSTESASVVIDPGFNSEVITEFLHSSQNKERLILLTHSHFDHIGGALSLRRDTETKIAIGIKDNPALSDSKINLSDDFGAELEPFCADILLNDGDEITVGDIQFRVLETPGHTVGGVCYLTEDVLFSGDTLFSGSIGRTDFYGGDYKTLENSIKRLYSLSDDIVVLSGHGEATTIKKEKTQNPFIRGL